VDRLVAAVRGMAEPAVRLRLFGRGELDGWLRDQAAEDGRILPPRFIERDELDRELRGASVLINPRPVDRDFVRYSFPSKMIEYLSAGVPVITTRLPGIPVGYEGRVVFADADTADGLRCAIEQVRAMPAEKARRLGAAGAAFVRSTCGPRQRGTALQTFIWGLGRRSGEPVGE
jgi:glycosyltransferase involved in cell wall biosynthesis